MILRNLHLILLFFVTLGNLSFSAILGQELDTLATLDAKSKMSLKNINEKYTDFSYRNKSEKLSIFETQLLKLNSKFTKDEEALNKTELELLHKSAKNYEAELSAQNLDITPELHTKFNLAQVYYKIFHLSNKSEALLLQKAKDLLLDEKITHPDFSDRDKALYLLSNIYRESGNKGLYEQTLLTLVKEHQSNEYSVLAFEKLGDMYFEAEKNQLAFNNYKKAYNLVQKSVFSSPSWESEIMYKLIWSGFRIGLSNEITNYSISFLNNPVYVSQAHYSKTSNDVAVVLANNIYFTKSRLEQKKFILQSAKSDNFDLFIKHYLEILITNNESQQVVEIAHALESHESLNPHFPILMLKIASYFKDSSNPEKYIMFLEKIAILAPETSLWRQQNGVLAQQTDINSLFKNAAVTVASYHYKRGLSLISKKHIQLAKDYFQILENLDQHHIDGSKWAMFVGHCYLHLDQPRDAQDKYIKILNRFTLTQSELIDVKYWQVVAQRDILLRLKSNENQEISPDEDLKLMNFLVESMSSQFPDSMRSQEALLIGASINAEFDQRDQTQVLYEKLLIISKDQSKRTSAIRGLVYNSIQNSPPKNVISKIKAILRSEDWSSLSDDLRQELFSVLEVSIFDEVERLRKLALFEEAANELIVARNEFPSNFYKPLFLKEAAFLYAMSNQWLLVEKTTDDYLSSQFELYKSDILYLNGLAQEEQFRYDQAAESYFKLARNFPKDHRTSKALDRSIQYFLSSRNFERAAVVKNLQIKLTENQFRRFNLKHSVINLYIKGNMYFLAHQSAQELMEMATTRVQRIRSKLAYIKTTYMIDNRNQAYQLAEKLISDLQFIKKKLTRRDYEQFYSEVNIILLDKYLKVFDQTPIAENSSQALVGINKKAKLFDSIQKNATQLLRLKLHNNHDFLYQLLGSQAENLAFYYGKILLEHSSRDDLYIDISLIQMQHKKYLAITKQYKALMTSPISEHNLSNLNSWVVYSLSNTNSERADNRNNNLIPETDIIQAL